MRDFIIVFLISGAISAVTTLIASSDFRNAVRDQRHKRKNTEITIDL